MLVRNCFFGGKSSGSLRLGVIGLSNRKGLGRCAVFLSALVSLNSYAQFEGTNALGNVNGTELQQRTGNAVQTVCGGFIANGVDQSRDDVTQQENLFLRCRQMVHTNNRIQDNGGPSAEDLNLNADQINSALQNVAGEEIAAAGSLATESAIGQGDMVSSRFAAILSSVSKLQVSSLNMSGSGGVMLASSELKFGQGGNAADGDLASEIPLGLYVNAFGGTSDKDFTDGEDGFEADSSGLAVGTEYRLQSNVVVGASVGIQSSRADFTNNTNVAGGGLDSNHVDLSAYGLYFNEDSYVDFVFGLGFGTYDLERRVVIADADGDPNTNTFDQTAEAETDSRFLRMSVGGGKEFVKGRLTIAPFGRMSLLNLNVDDYEEVGADELDLRVEEQNIHSLTIGGGARFVGTFSTSRAIILPQFSFEWVHEVRDESRQIISSYVHDPRNNPLTLVTDKPDKNYFVTGLGVSAVFTNRVQVFGELRSLVGLEDISQTLLSGGVRYEF